MQIVEVKNNLVKVSYDTAHENLILSGFIVIKDSNQSFIAQIIHLESNSHGSFAVSKFLFNFDDNGVITSYDGSIPDAKCPLEMVNSQELLALLPSSNPIRIGELAQQKTMLTLDLAIFEQKLLVCSEKHSDNALLTKNFVSQLSKMNKNILVLDLAGNIEECAELFETKIIAGKDFKLPLNYETINFIYEKGLDDAKAETKAIIQEIFLEVQDYVKALKDKFIPFETFKDVVDSQYRETNIVDLVLLKNKLLKYYEAGIFAQKKDEFNLLETSLINKNNTILDLSNMEPEFQREIISYVYSIIAEVNIQTGEEFYVILNLDDLSSDKKLLKQIFTTKQVYSIPICTYSYKYLKELKQLSKNLILFAPIQQQNDFASYNVFFNKLNASEFIIYGKATQHIPLIVKLSELPSEIVEDSQAIVNVEEKVELFQETILDQQIKKEVDKIYTSPRNESIVAEQSSQQSVEFIEVEDDLTEDDLDLIDDLNILKNMPEDDILSEISTDSDENIKIKEDSVPIIVEKTAEIIENSEVQADVEITEEVKIEQNEQEQFVESIGEQKEPEHVIVESTPANSIPESALPVYPAEIEPQTQSDEIKQGDVVTSAKYGKGTVEKLISYGAKTLCSINFDNAGRRLLDPSLAEIKKV